MFFVTAKHVADHVKGKDFFVRINTKAGKSGIMKALPNIRWFFHPTDQAADVALFPLGLDTQIFDFQPLPAGMLLTEELRLSKGIGIGDEVFITGLFVHHVGRSKNLPIVRTGNIAMIPEERIPIKNFGDMEAYLIEARSIGGLSGSPVFTIARNQEGPGATVYLLGLMHGHWNVESDAIIDEVFPDAGVRAGVNVGIALVTPASKILDTLRGPELQSMIEKLEAEEIAKNSPTRSKV